MSNRLTGKIIYGATRYPAFILGGIGLFRKCGDYFYRYSIDVLFDRISGPRRSLESEYSLIWSGK